MSIEGRFNEYREMLLDIQISDSVAANPLMQVSVVVDTGFYGFLALPPEVFRALGLAAKGNRRIVLADGTERMIPTYDIAVLWNDRMLVGSAIELPHTPLAGMEFLWNADLSGSVAWRLRGYAPA